MPCYNGSQGGEKTAYLVLYTKGGGVNGQVPQGEVIGYIQK